MSKYRNIVLASEKISWSDDSLLNKETELDFSNPYLPIDFASIAKIGPSLGKDLNHIVACSYINLFAFVEEYIIVQAVQLSNDALYGDPAKLRSLLRFADEEVKHQELFRNYVKTFNQQFKTNVEVLKESKEVTDFILSHPMEAVLMLTFHLEIITQEHYKHLKDYEGQCDIHFENILKYHWLEEAQHAKIDRLILTERCSEFDQDTLSIIFDQYTGILNAFYPLFKMQAKLNIESLSSIVGSEKIDKKHLESIITNYYQDQFVLLGVRNKQVCKLAKEAFNKDFSSCKFAEDGGLDDVA